MTETIEGLTKHRLFEIMGEVKRELGYRKYCYPKWVQMGKLRQEIADKQLNNLQGAYNILNFLYTNANQEIQLQLFKVEE